MPASACTAPRDSPSAMPRGRDLNHRSRCSPVVLGTKVVFLLALAALTACRQPPSDPQPVASSRLDKPYPLAPFEAVDLAGKRIATADWKDQVVVVNVWATWCAPCRRELPALASLQSRHRDR